VTINAYLIDLSSPNLIGTQRGEAYFWGDWGMVSATGYGAAIAIPYGFGKGLGKAIDQAARSALGNLVNQPYEAPRVKKTRKANGNENDSRLPGAFCYLSDALRFLPIRLWGGS